MSTRKATRPKFYTDEEAKALVAQAEVTLEVPLQDWQKVVLRGVLTGNSPVIIHPQRTPNKDNIHRALACIQEAVDHGLA